MAPGATAMHGFEGPGAQIGGVLHRQDSVDIHATNGEPTIWN